MAEAAIPVDLLNPGQVFACLGFLEAADILLGNAQGGFDWSDEPDVRFRLAADGEKNPAESVLSFLARATVRSVAPARSDLTTENWDVPTSRVSDDTPFPCAVPNSPATLPALYLCEETNEQIVVDHWADSRGATSRDNVKFWAGAGGYPGAALARDALNLVRSRVLDVAKDPFSLWAEQSSSFRLDWRRDYIPLDIGFSLNNHSSARFRTIGYPLVEILAAIGLTHARPEFISKLKYRYGVLGVGPESELFGPFFLRASLGDSDLPFPLRSFCMNLGWPGKEGQARCITTVYEEVSNE
jgi:CRISPR-associated protein Csx14